jgi:hypothetical protein
VSLNHDDQVKFSDFFVLSSMYNESWIIQDQVSETLANVARVINIPEEPEKRCNMQHLLPKHA